MDFLILGFITGLSLILAIGAQNIFVIEQGLKKHYVFIVCLFCSISSIRVFSEITESSSILNPVKQKLIISVKSSSPHK